MVLVTLTRRPDGAVRVRRYVAGRLALELEVVGGDLARWVRDATVSAIGAPSRLAAHP